MITPYTGKLKKSDCDIEKRMLKTQLGDLEILREKFDLIETIAGVKSASVVKDFILDPEKPMSNQSKESWVEFQENRDHSNGRTLFWDNKGYSC